MFQRHRDLFFWYGLFIAGLAPVLQIVPIVTLMNDRYLYLPLLGGAPFVCAAVSLLSAGLGWRQRIAMLAAGLFILLLLPRLTVNRAAVWQNPLILWRDAVKNSPDSTYAALLLAEEAFARGRWDEALAAAYKLREVPLHRQRALEMTGIILTRLGDVGKGREALELLVREYPDALNAYYLLAENYLVTGETGKAEAAYRAILVSNPYSERARDALRSLKGGKASR
jgi:Flp pilus assembly protein TadD